MHRSTRIIVGVELTSLLLCLVADLLVANASLRMWLQVGILGVAALVGIMLLGWAKPRGSANKIASIILILTAVVYQLAIFVLLGIKLGFVTNVYRWNLISIFQVFLPLTLLIVLTEILRGQMINKGQRSRGVIIMTAAVLSLLQIIVVAPMYFPLSMQSLFELILAVIFPIVLTNILLTFIAYNYDYRANIVYRLIMELPIYLLPIYPDASEFLKTLFLIAITVTLIVGFMSVRGWGEKVLVVPNKRMKVKRELTDRQRKLLRGAKYLGVALVILLIAGYVGLMSGLFKYHFLAIGSGSMEPVISRGDLVLVEKTNQYDGITAGEVLVYRHKNVIVVHRVSEVEMIGKNYVYHTQGDANESGDAWQVSQGDVIGVAKGKIAMFGFPTLWLNELFNKG